MRLAAFTDSGYFWLPDDKDRNCQVPGTLTVSEAGIVTLETFGYPSGDPLSLAQGSFGPANSKLTRIFGNTRERGAVTLVDGICTQSGRQSAASGVSFASSAILAETLLAGGHFDDEEPFFDRLACKIEGLHEWLGVSGFTTEHESHCTSITYQRPDPLPFQVGDDVKGEFGLEHSISFHAPAGIKVPDARYSAYIKLSTSTSWTTEDVINWATRMRNFISLGTGVPVAITALAGWPLKDGQEVANETNREVVVEIIRESGQHSSKPNANFHPVFMNFTYKGLGNGLSDSIKAWIDLCSEWPQPVLLFFDALYGDGILPEDLRFIKVEESLQKLAPVMGIEECAGSHERIRKLASKFSELLGIEEGGETEFAKRVRDTRNWCVHRSPPSWKYQPCVGIDLIRLLMQCEALLFCCFAARVLGGEAAAIQVLRDARPIKTRLWRG